MNRILVVNVNWLGDVIFSVPVFRALKEAYPQAKLSCLAVPRVREALEMNPFIDEIIMYDEEGAHRSPLAKLRLIRQLKQKKFDAAFLLHRSLTRALLVFLAGIPQRIGYDEKGRGFLLTHRVPKSTGGGIHRSDHYLKVIESFGIAVHDRSYQLVVPAEVKQEIKNIFEQNDIHPYDFKVAVHCGGNWDLKRWPPERWAALAERLVREQKAKVIFSGGKDDVAVSEAIIARSELRALNLAGKTNLKQLAALLNNVDLVISADSGPIHLASSVGTPVIGLFGPTRPEVTGPRGSAPAVILQKDLGCNREPCYNLQCPDNVCMYSITTEDILRVVNETRAKI